MSFRAYLCPTTLILRVRSTVQAYTHLLIPSRSRFQQYEKLKSIHKSYLVAGSPTPLEEWQNLRDFGHRIAQADTPAVFVR